MVRKKKVRYEPQANLVPKREDPGNEVGRRRIAWRPLHVIGSQARSNEIYSF